MNCPKERAKPSPSAPCASAAASYGVTVMMLWDCFYRTLCLCVAMNYSTPICVVEDPSPRRKVEAAFYSKGEAEETHNTRFYMTCRLKNYTSGCQAVVLGELLKFTTEFKARSSLPARTHSVTCMLKRSGCRLPASSFLVKRSWRGTTEKVEDKNCQRRGAVARFAGLSAQRQGAKEASSFRYFSTSFELFVTADFHGSV